MHHTDARLNARLLNKFDGDLEAVPLQVAADDIPHNGVVIGDQNGKLYCFGG